jgi:hypothetical protein
MFFSGFPTITEHLVITEHDNLLYCDYCELNHIHPKSFFGALSAFISAPPYLCVEIKLPHPEFNASLKKHPTHF